MSRLAPLFALAALLPASAQAQGTTYTLYGTPGLIEMPTAQAADDAEITANVGAFAQQQRMNFSFQLTPRLSGTFRYTSIPEVNGPGTDGTFDRSFDLRYRFIDEGQFGDWTPGVAIGLQDFLGTGLLPAEYIVASKTITPNIIATAGLGWGRFGSQNSFTNPLGLLSDSFETRPSLNVGQGGKISANQFFRGDAALFGGVTWDYSDKLTFKAEYSSDAYIRESAVGTLDSKSPVNLGVTYRYSDNITADLAYLYGSEIAVGLTYALNPRKRLAPSGLEPAPMPVRERGTVPVATPLQTVLAKDDIRLNGLATTGDTTTVRYTNNGFRSEAQALGRVARAMTQTQPDQISSFTLVPQQAGIALSATTLNRTDLETLENSATAADDLLARAQITDAAGVPALPDAGDPIPAFTWGISPYAAIIVFNGDAPAQLDAGLSARAAYEISPNLILKGGMRQSVRGKRELEPVFQTPNSYPNVRTDGDKFGLDGHPVITDLTLAHYGRPAADLYSRVSLGYLERMYGGASAEVLWKPVDSNLAIGAELNYARLRDTDMLLGFQDFDTVSGHLSAYYSFDNGFHTQLDVGRYLAGDWGATFALDREFDNGWSVGAYFTLTDMPFDEFGEGSFDKGIKITAPVDFFFGNASKRKVSTKLASLTRDGGARLNVDGRLYETVRDGHVAGGLGDTWGKVWR